MNDAHYHRGGYATYLSLGGREYRFYGVHPWEAHTWSAEREASLREALAADSHAGVGEIGLDRLKKKEIAVVPWCCTARSAGEKSLRRVALTPERFPRFFSTAFRGAEDCFLPFMG